MKLQPHAATTDHFVFTHPTAGGEYVFQHRLYDIPLPRSTMHNITLTATDDGGAVYAYDYTVTTSDEEGNVLSETTEHAEHVITPEQLEVITAPTSPLDAMRRQLWQSFDAYARAQTDDNSRVSINLIATNPASTAQQLQRATAWAGWWSNLWTVYAVKRAQLLATQTMPTTDFPTEVGTAPYTIWEIAE